MLYDDVVSTDGPMSMSADEVATSFATSFELPWRGLGETSPQAARRSFQNGLPGNSVANGTNGFHDGTNGFHDGEAMQGAGPVHGEFSQFVR